MDVVDERKETIKLLISKRENIRETLFSVRDQLNAVRELRSFDLDTIMTVAQNISYSGHAPPGWVPGAPLLKNHPPAPQPEEMRGGMLEKYNLQCKAKKKQSVSTVDNSSSSAAARELFDSIRLAKETPVTLSSLNANPTIGDSSAVAMEVDESVVEAAAPAPVEDVHVGKGRKTNTISFTSYDDSSDED